MADLVLDLFTLFGPVPPRGAEPGLAPLQALLNQHGVAGAVTLSTRGLYHNAHAGNRETQALCAEAGGAFLPAAVLDPRLPDPTSTIAGARMLCLLPAAQGWPLPFAPLTDLLAAIASVPTPIWFETARLGDATQFAELARAANLTQPIILGSVTGVNLTEALSVAKKLPNAFLATDGLCGIGEVMQAVKALGAERVAFASGVPHRSLGAALALHERAGLTPEQSNLILGANTKKLMASNSGGAA